MAYFNNYLVVILLLFNLTSVSRSQIQQRNPVLEYCTGTWCQWCPCGHLVAEEILTAFPNAIIMGYHGPANGSDPFSFFQGNSIISSLGFSAYPTGIIDRVSGIQSRSAWNGWVYNRDGVPASVSINVNTVFNPVTRELNGTIDFTALTDLSGQFKYNVILLEDGIVWSQSGNSSCPGDPNYIHKNVVRDMMNGALGEEIINGSWILNQVITKSINRVIPIPPGPGPDMSWENCSIVVLVYKVGSPLASNGEIQQAEKYSLTNINVPYMGVTSPNGGENWIGGSDQIITWESNLVNDVRIEFSNDGGINWEIIVDSIQNTEIYEWSVPYTLSSDCKIKLTDANNSTLYDESDSLFSIYLMEINVNEGWNILSVPLCQDNMTISGLFPTAISEAFGYGAGYFVEDTLHNGHGYWIKFDSSEVVYNGGNHADSNVIAVNLGWNLIGPFHENVSLSSIVTIPDNLFISPFYGYDEGYYTTTEFNVGKGYWVKTWSDGLVIIENNECQNSKMRKNELHFPDSWGKILLTDATGRRFTLYAVNEEVDLNQYEMPPLPPQGIFDIRYSSNRIAEDINSSVHGIDMTGVTYPLTVRAEKMDIRIQDESGKIINENVKDGEEIVINDSQINKLMISGELLPTVYALQQNYPNPFNPNTAIKFSIPKEVQVNLTVFNILGEKVKDLKNEKMKSGYYEVEFDATSLASGIYLYRIKAGDFVETKKMVLLK